MNTCIHCGFIGDVELFRSKNVCIKCRKKQKGSYSKNYLEKHREKIAEYQKVYVKENKKGKKEYDKKYNRKNANKRKKYYEDNKEIILKKKKEYRKNNKEKELLCQKRWNNKNKEHKQQYNKMYREQHKEERNKKRRERRKSDIRYLIKGRIRNSFNQALKLYSKNGKTKTLREYGIDIKSIIEKLGPKPDGDYHIDHIFPITAFDLNSPDHIQLCWHQDNLQWLDGRLNESKNNNYNREEFGKYSETGIHNRPGLLYVKATNFIE